ncbi:MAG: hypothetical protein ACWA5R_00330 [bacterium]
MTKFLLIIALSILSQTALAQIQYDDFTPESGWYWTPELSGRGLAIEIQDDVLVLTVYGYDTAGNPEWYLTAGPMDGNNFYQGSLSRFYDGQCLGCSYTGPSYQPGWEGTIQVEWTTQDSALVRWTPQVTDGNFVAAETFTVVRQLVADAVIEPYQKPEGQWKLVMDFTEANTNFPFLADILTFDSIRNFNGQTQTEGYRESLASPAAGTYDAPSDTYLFVIEEDSATYLLLYDVQIGVNGWRGYAEFYDPSIGPSYNGYPFEAFRSASKSWAINGVGPSKSLKVSNTGILGLLDETSRSQLLINHPDLKVLNDKTIQRLTPLLTNLESSLSKRN